VQNPSAVLTLLAIILRPIFRYKLIVDAHNAGVYPFEEGFEKFRFLFPLFHRNSDLTIVTNSKLFEVIKKNKGRPYILPDPLPAISRVESLASKRDKFLLTLICTFASDEPYLNVVEAAKQLPSNISIQFTGNYSRLHPKVIDECRKYVNLMGYLADEDYIEALSKSDVIIDLTNFSDCLVCGAYESVALGVPVILSDTPVLREYFYKGAIYSQNDPVSLTKSIMKICANLPKLRSDVSDLKVELDGTWKEQFNGLKIVISGLNEHDK